MLDAEEFGLNIHDESVQLAISFALNQDCDNFHFLCFDSITKGVYYSVLPDGSVDLVSGAYELQVERLLQRCSTLKHEFITP